MIFIRYLYCVIKCHNHSHLDSFTLTVHNENIFCKSCYGKNFGPSGYGFGGGGAGMMRAETGAQPVVSKPVVDPMPKPALAPANNGVTNGNHIIEFIENSLKTF